MIALKVVLILVGAVPVVWAIIKTGSEAMLAERGGTEPIRQGRIGWALALLIVMCLLSASIGQVPAGYRGVVLLFSATTGEVKEEGFYAVFPPYIKKVRLSSVQTQAYNDNASAASADMQFVTTDVTLNWSLVPDQVDEIWKTFNENVVTTAITPAVQESIKASTAQFAAEELITRRPEVRDAIQREITERLDNVTTNGIKVHALSITNFDFSEEFAGAIEAKQVAEQDALKAENDLIRIKTEAEQKIATAEAQAEALKLQKEAVTKELIQLRIVEAQMAAIEVWDGKLPEVITGNAPVPILDVFNPQE